MAFGVMSGARAKLGFYDSNTKDTVFLGIYSSVSYNYSIDVQPVYILGSYSAASLDNVSMDTIHLSCSGWRVVNHGPMAEAKFPRLDQLANAGYLSMAIFDRQSDLCIANVTKVRPVGFSGGFTMRTLATVDMTYMGILLSDETAKDNDESPSSMRLPQD
jgi:hypothetical protein